MKKLWQWICESVSEWLLGKDDAKKVVVDPTIKDTQPSTNDAKVPICSCTNGKGTFSTRDAQGKVNEQIETNFYGIELRCWLGDSGDFECSITNLVVSGKHAWIKNGKLYVECFSLPNGDLACYSHYQQPSTSSPKVYGQGNAIGKGLLRLYFKRKR